MICNTCEYCSEEFRTKNNLYRHLKISTCGMKKKHHESLLDCLSEHEVCENEYAPRTPPRYNVTDAENENIKLKICMQNKINIVGLCGHSACEECSSFLQNCHMCRQPWTHSIKIYL